MTDAPTLSESDTQVAVVRDMLSSWSAQDWPRVVSLFAPNGRLHSVMSAPVDGREAFAERVRTLAIGLERIQIHVKTIGVIDGRVFVERIDDFDANGNHAEVPVVGILRIEDGLVVEWLEYYDRATLLAGLGINPADDFAQR